MTDDDQQTGRALRDRLDQELATVRATVGAREELRRRVAATSRSGSISHGWRRFGPTLAVPLAMAGVVIAVLAGPTALRHGGSRSTASQPSHASPAAVPVPTVAVTTAPPLPAVSKPRPTPTAAPTAARVAVELGMKSLAGLRISVTPKEVKLGQQVGIEPAGPLLSPGTLTVDWADGSPPVTLPSSPCDPPISTTSASPARKALAAEEVKALATTFHSYQKPGRYLVIVSFTPCGTTRTVKITRPALVYGP